MSTYSDIDYLFEEMTFPFGELCGELRNHIYESYFANTLGSDGGTQIVKISENGNIVLPSLSVISREILFETKGYMQAALSKPGTIFHAQIRDYNPKPLLATLERLSKMFQIPKENLVERTKVSLVGEFHFENLYQWTTENIADPIKTPFFAHKASRISGFGDVWILEGQTALKTFIMQHRALEASSPNGAAWKKLARSFYEIVEEGSLAVEAQICAWNSDGCGRELTEYTFKTIAKFHHMILKKGDSCGQKQFEMAEVMYAFHLECDRACALAGF
jgi:hypothetical protein